jgi:hypothetical protein
MKDGLLAVKCNFISIRKRLNPLETMPSIRDQKAIFVLEEIICTTGRILGMNRKNKSPGKKPGNVSRARWRLTNQDSYCAAGL